MTPPETAIRAAHQDDLPLVAELAANLVRLHHAFDAARFFVPDRVAEGYAWWLGKEIDRPEVVLLVAERGSAIVGYAYGRLEARDWNVLLDAHGSLLDVWVEPEHRRAGVADALVDAVIAALRAKGAPRVVLHAAAGNEPALALFARRGFRRTMVELTLELADDAAAAPSA